MYHDALVASLWSVAKLALLAALVGRVALLAALPGRESVRTARPEGVRVADEGRATLYMAYSPRDGVLPELCITSCNRVEVGCLGVSSTFLRNTGYTRRAQLALAKWTVRRLHHRVTPRLATGVVRIVGETRMARAPRSSSRLRCL